MATRGNPRPSEAIRGHQRLSEAIRGPARTSAGCGQPIALWAVVSGCVGFLLGQHVMLFSPEDGHRCLDEKLPSTSESLEVLQGRRAISILKRCLNLRPKMYRNVEAWFDAHKAVPRDAPYYDRGRAWVPPKNVTLSNHPVFIGSEQLQAAFIAMHNFMWVGGLLPISPWGHRRGSMKLDESIIGRWGFTRYFEAMARMVPRGAKCLSWDEKHAKLVPACDPAKIWTFAYHGVKNAKKSIVRVNTAKRILGSEYAQLATREREACRGATHLAYDMCTGLYPSTHHESEACRLCSARALLPDGLGWRCVGRCVLRWPLCAALGGWRRAHAPPPPISPCCSPAHVRVRTCVQPGGHLRASSRLGGEISRLGPLPFILRFGRV